MNLLRRRKPVPENPEIPPPLNVDNFPRGLADGDKRKPLATAQWPADNESLSLLGAWQPGRFLLGRDLAGRYLGYADDRHILTVAGSRAGKGVSLIVPALLTWPHSCIAIDPKGELATITATRRGQGSEWALPMDGQGKVYVLDPFKRVTGPAAHYRAAFNPLADLNADADDGLDMAGQIADALVVQQEGPGAHWTMNARAFLLGLVLYVAKVKEPASRNLVELRRLLLQPKPEFDAMIEHMSSLGGVIGRSANSLNAKPLEERGSVLSTCDTQTAWLEGESMASVLRGSDFRLEELKERRVSVYLCLPATRLATHGRWLRLLVGMTLEAMERTGPLKSEQYPVLFVLDEFAALGHMPAIEKAAGQIASFGVKLWPIIQDLTQLKRDYRDAWETFMGNAGLLTFHGNTDLTTLEHISKRLGETELIRTSTNTAESWQRQTGSSQPELFGRFESVGQSSASDTAGRTVTATEHVLRGPLMNPDEIARYFRREAGTLLAFCPHIPPGFVALNRCVYYSRADDGLFGGWFDPPPSGDLPLTRAAERAHRDRAGRAV